MRVSENKTVVLLNFKLPNERLNVNNSSEEGVM